MELFIEYCTSWNYLPEASRVESELKQSYPDLYIKLVKGSDGIFNVIYNGKLIFSKKNTAEQRFPRKGEIVALFKQEIG